MLQTQSEIPMQTGPDVRPGSRLNEGKTSSKPTFYRPELDLLRLAAFLLVFIHHALPNSADEYQGLFTPGVARVLSAVASACGYGLCLFFALSAYLIAELLLREKSRTGTVHIRSFYVRRILRIWPLYLVGIAIGLAYAIIRGPSEDLWRMLAYLFMVGNVFSVFHGWSANCMTHLWSISIEEQFYLIWPGINKYLGKRGILICCAGGIVLANSTLFILGQQHAALFTTVWANTFVQFELFVTGILLAIWLNGNKPRLNLGSRFGIVVAVALIWFASIYYLNAFGIARATSGWALMAGYALNSAGCAGLIYAILGMDISKVSGIFIYLGKISYGLYVFHLLGLLCAKVLIWETHMPEFAGVLRAGLGLLFTIALAMASYRWLELPFLRLKANYTWVPSRPA